MSFGGRVTVIACPWEKLHLKNEAMLDESNQLVVELAADLGLTNK
jgi:hypothetical protein